MDVHAIDNYGGVKLDALPMSNPETQLSAAQFNRLAADAAQMTNTILRAAVIFPTVAAVAPQTVPAASVNHRSVWGNGAAQKPVVTKTAPGRYTITYATSFTDVLGVVETVGFFDAHGEPRSTVSTDVLKVEVLTATANVITIGVMVWAGGAWGLADTSGGVVFNVSVWAI